MSMCSWKNQRIEQPSAWAMSKQEPKRYSVSKTLTHLTYAVNAVKDILIEALGRDAAFVKFKERGIHDPHLHQHAHKEVTHERHSPPDNEGF